MPCLILCGHPCAGKTRLAHAIRDRALALPDIRHVVIINEGTACPDVTIAACYANAAAEKRTRGALKSSFDRCVSERDNGTLVILDASNYIKGFRYELHCISKAAGQKHGVVWVLNESRLCKEWNAERRRQAQDGSGSIYYSDALMDELIMRFEPPDARNRWDNPLYRIDVRPDGAKQQSGLAMEALEQSVYNMHKLSEAVGNDNDDTTTMTQKKTSSTFKRAGFKKKAASAAPAPDVANDAASKGAADTKNNTTQQATHQDNNTTTAKQLLSLDEQIDEMLHSFLQNVAPLKQGVSTQYTVSSDANVLHQVDAITQKVCSLIAAAQNKTTTASGRLSITLPSNSEPIWFDFQRRIGLPELRRLRGQYIQWVGTHPPEDSTERGIAQAFIAYIAAQ